MRKWDRKTFAAVVVVCIIGLPEGRESVSLRSIEGAMNIPRAGGCTCVEPEICRRGLVELADASRLPNMFTTLTDAPPSSGLGDATIGLCHPRPPPPDASLSPPTEPREKGPKPRLNTMLRERVSGIRTWSARGPTSPRHHQRFAIVLS